MTTLFPDFAEVEKYYNSLINYEHRFPLGGNRDWAKLEPTRLAVERMGLPFSLPRCFHIAGTKGKGSVAAFLESLFSPDYRTLVFTSPHLISLKERVRVKGAELPDELWCQGTAEISGIVKQEPAIRLSYFETTFVFALWVARQLDTQVQVIECGLGGRWDATNVLTNTLPVLTTVDYDHTDVLGDTLEKIARDKGGIIKGSAPVIVGLQVAEVRAVYEELIAQHHAQGLFFGRDFGHRHQPHGKFAYMEVDSPEISNLRLGVRGDHQITNAAVAICALRRVAPEMAEDAIRERLARCVIPGRLQLLPGKPDVLVDVAHNPVSFAALANTLKSEFAGRRKVLVMGMMKDKDARSSLAKLVGVIDECWFVDVPSPRSFPADELRTIASELGFEVTETTSREVAFEKLNDLDPHELGIVAGSFYLVGDFLLWRRHAGTA